MIDTKKFVVAFLALALLISSTALVLSGVSGGPSRTAAAPMAQNSNSGSPTPSNAFALQSATGVGDDLTSDASAASSTDIDPNNLTDNFGNSLLNNIVDANPDGPRDNGDGTQTVTAPGDAQTVLSDMSGNPALNNLQVPDWDFEAAQITTRIATSSSQDDVARYAEALGNIMEARFVQTNLQAMANANFSDPQDLSVILSNVQGALSDIGGLTVPKDLADFHKGLIKILVYEKNAIALTQNASGDPLKAMLVLQSENDKYQAAVQEFQSETQKVAKNKSLSLGFSQANLISQTKNQSGALALLNEVFGVSEAHAQFGGAFFDAITEAETTGELLQTIWDHLQGVILQMLKNYLTLLLQKLMLAFVKNSGNPRFLTAWSSWAFNAFNAAAGSALGQITPGLCANYSSQVTGWLQNSYPSAPPTSGGTSLNGAKSTNCTLGSSVNNVPAYYNNFSAGGFAGFGALLAPNNNPFGTFAQGHDSMQAVGGSQQTAATNKALGGSGFKGTQYCLDYLTGAHYNPTGPLCKDGSEPFTTTPGNTVGDATNRNLNSSIDLIVNANDWTGLLDAILGALFQNWLNAGENGLLGTLAPAPPSPASGGGVTCQAGSSIASSSMPVAFTVTGAVSSAVWSAPGGNPPSGSGTSFNTSYAVPGTYTANVTVTDATGKKTSTSCSVTIN